MNPTCFVKKCIYKNSCTTNYTENAIKGKDAIQQ